MADEMKKEEMSADEMMEEIDVYTLTDEDGNESQFELIDEYEMDGKTYYALTELDADGNQVSEEYVILRLDREENGEEILISIDDDEEFDKIADYFDDKFSAIDYDN